jgi:hypothetical protein
MIKPVGSPPPPASLFLGRHRFRAIEGMTAAASFFANHQPRYRLKADRIDFTPIDRLRKPTLSIND